MKIIIYLEIWKRQEIKNNEKNEYAKTTKKQIINIFLKYIV